MIEYSNLVKTLRIAAAEVEHGRFVHKHGARELLAEAADRIAALEAELAEAEERIYDLEGQLKVAKAWEGSMTPSEVQRLRYQATSDRKAMDIVSRAADLLKNNKVQAVVEAARELGRLYTMQALESGEEAKIDDAENDLWIALSALDGSKTDG